MSRLSSYGLVGLGIVGGTLLIYGLVSRTSSPFLSADSPAPRAMFGSVSLRLEYATSSAQRERGLAGVRHLDFDQGMLFIFPADDRHGFWMKDMVMPIDIFWLDAQGQVVSMVEQVEPTSYPAVFYPFAPARYVLETRAGFAKWAQVATGTPLELQKFPSVSE